MTKLSIRWIFCWIECLLLLPGGNQKLNNMISTRTDEEYGYVDEFWKSIGHKSWEEEDNEKREVYGYLTGVWCQERGENPCEHNEREDVGWHEDEQMCHEDSIEEHDETHTE